MSEQVRTGFAEFVAARYETLVRSAYLLTGDRGLAEDAVHRTSRAPAALRKSQVLADDAEVTHG